MMMMSSAERSRKCNSSYNTSEVLSSSHSSGQTQACFSNIMCTGSSKWKKVAHNLKMFVQHGIVSASEITEPIKHFHLSAVMRFSQPAHVVTLFAMTYLSFILSPREAYTPKEPSTISVLLYISTFATHFGTQMWMTFISGIVLFFNLPRRIFGMVQRQLFPKYFLLNSVLGFITLVTFSLHHPAKRESEETHQHQVWTLAGCFVLDLLTRLYIVPEMLDILEARTAMEKRAGVGMEVGRHEPGKLKDSPLYLELHRRFRTFHGLCAVTNMAAMGLNAVHMYYLACKLGSLT